MQLFTKYFKTIFKFLCKTRSGICCASPYLLHYYSEFKLVVAGYYWCFHKLKLCLCIIIPAWPMLAQSAMLEC